MKIKIEKSMWAFFFTALGGLIVIIGAGFQYKNRLDDQRSATIKESQRRIEAEQRAFEAENILQKATEIILSQKEVIDQTDKISKLQETLKDKNEEIISSQNQTIAFITGGDSYCFIDVRFDNNNDPYFIWFHSGEMTLRNIVSKISDRGKREYLIEKYGRNYDNPQFRAESELTTFNIQEEIMRPDYSKYIPITVDKNQKNIILSIHTKLDNGILSQLIEIIDFRDKKNRTYKSQVFKNGKLIADLPYFIQGI